MPPKAPTSVPMKGKGSPLTKAMAGPPTPRGKAAPSTGAPKTRPPPPSSRPSSSGSLASTPTEAVDSNKQDRVERDKLRRELEEELRKEQRAAAAQQSGDKSRSHDRSDSSPTKGTSPQKITAAPRAKDGQQTNAPPPPPTAVSSSKKAVPKGSAGAPRPTPAAKGPVQPIPLRAALAPVDDDDEDDDEDFFSGSDSDKSRKHETAQVQPANNQPSSTPTSPQGTPRKKAMPQPLSPKAQATSPSSPKPTPTAKKSALVSPRGSANGEGSAGSPRPRPTALNSVAEEKQSSQQQQSASPSLSPMSRSPSVASPKKAPRPGPKSKQAGGIPPKPQQTPPSRGSGSPRSTTSPSGGASDSSGGARRAVAPPPGAKRRMFTTPGKVESLNDNPDWQLRPDSPDGDNSRAASPGAAAGAKPDMQFAASAPLEDILVVEDRQREEKRRKKQLEAGSDLEDDFVTRPTITTKKLNRLSQPKRKVTPKAKQTEEEKEWEASHQHVGEASSGGGGPGASGSSGVWASEHHGGTASQGNVYMYSQSDPAAATGGTPSKNNTPAMQRLAAAAKERDELSRAGGTTTSPTKTQRGQKHGGKPGEGILSHPSDYCFIRVRTIGRTDDHLVPRVAIAKNMLLASIAADLELPTGGQFQFRGLTVHPHATPTTLGLRCGPEHVSALTFVCPVEEMEEVARGQLLNNQVGCWCNALACLYTLISSLHTLPPHAFADAGQTYSDAAEVAAALEARREMHTERGTAEVHPSDADDEHQMVGEWADEVEDDAASHHYPHGVVVDSHKVGYTNLSGLTVTQATVVKGGTGRNASPRDEDRLNTLREYGYTDVHAGGSTALMSGQGGGYYTTPGAYADNQENHQQSSKHQRQGQPPTIRGQGSFGLDALTALQHAKAMERKSKMDQARAKRRKEWQNRFALAPRGTSPVTGRRNQQAYVSPHRTGLYPSQRNPSPRNSSSRGPHTVHVYDSDPMLYREEVVLWDDAEEVFEEA